ncbi:MAG: hypothetical protein ACP5UM_07135 [Anaerolineae bacterium]
MGRKYKDPPLMEAVCEFRLAADSPWDLTIPGLIYEKLYAAFCSARNHAARYMGFSPSGKAEDHRYLIEHLQKRGLVGLASSLRELRIWRNQCDYDDLVQGLEHMVRDALESAQEILKDLVSSGRVV